MGEGGPGAVAGAPGPLALGGRRAPVPSEVHPTREVSVKRAIRMLFGAGALCLLAPYGAEARLLKNAQTGSCMGVDPASKEEGGDVKVFRCDGKPNQQWSPNRVSPGVYNLVNEQTRKCLGVNHARTTPGATIQQLECDGSDPQKWTFKTCGGTPCTVNVGSGLCLSAQHLGQDVRVEQLRCDGGTTQAWTHD